MSGFDNNFILSQNIAIMIFTIAGANDNNMDTNVDITSSKFFIQHALTVKKK